MRGDYKQVWNELAASYSQALMHVVGSEDQSLLDRATEETLSYLEFTVGIKPEDVFLEVGCGVGRVGRGLAPRVRQWVGCDVSPRMLAFAREQLSGFGNVRLAEISGHDLAPIASASVDVVYSTVVFMHLDEWERYSYVREAFRVLRPGGRFWCDNVNLCTDDGWKLFEETFHAFPPGLRPAHITKCSTPAELETYLTRAGFADVRTRTRHLWVDAWGVKPADRELNGRTPGAIPGEERRAAEGPS